MTSVPSEKLLAMYRSMMRIRITEEAVADRYSEQEMRCPVHLSIGQEATAVGVCAALRQDDQIVSTHRNHAHYLAKGGDLKAMIAEMHGKATGCCGGRGGSMHLFDTVAGILISLPIVASSIPIGVGAALAMKQKGSDSVAVVFLGDASVEEGVFHESVNFAVLKKLPVVFVCENNLYSVYTHLNLRQPDRPIAKLAEGHGLPAQHGNGNDIAFVHQTATEAVARARGKEGPTLLVYDTYRWREHCGPNFDNELGYRAEQEFSQWRKNCPVETLQARLMGEGVLKVAQQEAWEAEIKQEVDAAFDHAKQSPFPAADSAEQWLYA